MTAPQPRPIAAVRLDGGRLCIDFANSIHDRFAATREDYLATPERYGEWARRAGALADDEALVLPDTDGGRARLMGELDALREATFHLLSARLDGAAPPAEALGLANAWLLKARQDQVLDSDGRLVLRSARGDATLPFKRVALDLVDTFAKARAGEMKLCRCANQTSCGWLFADTSKNRRRRWCAMETCGVISKMATLRERRAGLTPSA